MGNALCVGCNQWGGKDLEEEKNCYVRIDQEFVCWGKERLRDKLLPLIPTFTWMMVILNDHHFKNIKKDKWSNLGAVSEMPTISIYFQGGLVWESGRFLSNVYNSMGVASTKNQGGIEICAAIHTKIIQFSGSLDPENQGGLASLQYSVHADMNWMGDHAPLSKFHICHLLGLLTVMASLWDTYSLCSTTSS